MQDHKDLFIIDLFEFFQWYLKQSAKKQKSVAEDFCLFVSKTKNNKSV